METARNVAALLAILVGAVLWVEFGNRTAIEPPEAAGYRPCDDSDAMPYSARCIEFMMGQHSQSRPTVAN